MTVVAMAPIGAVGTDQPRAATPAKRFPDNWSGIQPQIDPKPTD